MSRIFHLYTSPPSLRFLWIYLATHDSSGRMRIVFTLIPMMLSSNSRLYAAAARSNVHEQKAGTIL